MTNKKARIQTVIWAVLTACALLGLGYLLWCWHDVLTHQLTGGTHNMANIFYRVALGR